MAKHPAQPVPGLLPGRAPRPNRTAAPDTQAFEAEINRLRAQLAASIERERAHVGRIEKLAMRVAALTGSIGTPVQTMVSSESQPLGGISARAIPTLAEAMTRPEIAALVKAVRDARDHYDAMSDGAITGIDLSPLFDALRQLGVDRPQPAPKSGFLCFDENADAATVGRAIAKLRALENTEIASEMLRIAAKMLRAKSQTCEEALAEHGGADRDGLAVADGCDAVADALLRQIGGAA